MPEAAVEPCIERDQRLAAFQAVLDAADRELLFYGPRLDPALIEDAGSQRRLQAFLTASPRHGLRVLVTEPGALVRQCPRLLALCRRLPSRCALRVPAADADPLDEALYCADRHHALHRPPTERSLHLWLRDHPLRVAPLRQRVDEMWDHARESSEFQHLVL